MIVDDNRTNLAMLEAILSSQGYEVIAYERGEDALEAAVQNPPDLILLDILMPDMDGFEVCRRLKADWLLW
ncbi:MAG: response regulator, partial [Bacteroidota bacterium]